MSIKSFEEKELSESQNRIIVNIKYYHGKHQNAKQQPPQSEQQSHRPLDQSSSNINSDLIGSSTLYILIISLKKILRKIKYNMVCLNDETLISLMVEVFSPNVLIDYFSFSLLEKYKA